MGVALPIVGFSMFFLMKPFNLGDVGTWNAITLT